MFELIAGIIFIGSIFGIAMVLFRKIPVLAELPVVFDKNSGERVLLEIKNKAKSIFPKEVFLQKILSQIRIIIMKIERKIDGWLQKIRQNLKNKKSKREKLNRSRKELNSQQNLDQEKDNTDE